MDLDSVSPLGGIICHSGGQRRFVDLMRKASVYNAVHGQANIASTFIRTPTRAAPHNVFVRATELLGLYPGILSPSAAVRLLAHHGIVVRGEGPHSHCGYQLFPFRACRPAPGPGILRGRCFCARRRPGPILNSTGAQLSANNFVVIRVAINSGQGVPTTTLIGSARPGSRPVAAPCTVCGRNLRRPIRFISSTARGSRCVSPRVTPGYSLFAPRDPSRLALPVSSAAVGSSLALSGGECQTYLALPS